MPVTPRPANCHPERLAKTADGRCENCWRRDHRAKQRTLKTAVGAIEHAKEVVAETVEKARTLAELVAEAEQELQAAIPEAAKALRLAAKIAALKGDSRPAEVLLNQFAVPTADGKGTRRLLEPPPKQVADSGPSGPQILIGIRVEQPQPALAPVLAPVPGTVIGTVVNRLTD